MSLSAYVLIWLQIAQFIYSVCVLQEFHILYEGVYDSVGGW